MALTVQDETGLVDGANAYVTPDEFRTYCEDRLKDFSLNDDDDIIGAAIIRATDYMDSFFAFVGYRSEKTQTTEWPREWAYNSRGDSEEGIPTAVKHACIEYAFRGLSLPDLMADPVRDTSGREVLKKKEVIGPIEEETEYASGSNYDTPRYPAVEAILKRAGLIASSGGGGLSSTPMYRGS